MKTLQIGTISRGTLRAQDILPELMLALEDLDPPKAQAYTNELESLGFSRCMDGISFGEEQPWDEHAETIGEIISELMNALQEFAPPYTYVGTLEGDGSDIGVWIDHDAIREAVADGELETITDPAQLDSRAFAFGDVSQVLHVNDHGNMTLYVRGESGNFREAWSVV